MQNIRWIAGYVPEQGYCVGVENPEFGTMLMDERVERFGADAEAAQRRCEELNATDHATHPCA